MQGKWPLDKCGPILVPNKIGVLLVWLLTSCSCLSAYHQTSITRWPLDLRQLTLRFSFQASCRCGCERCLMNCLARNSLWLPTRTPPPPNPLHSAPLHFLQQFYLQPYLSSFLLSWCISRKSPPEVWTAHLHRCIFGGACMLRIKWKAWGSRLAVILLFLLLQTHLLSHNLFLHMWPDMGKKNYNFSQDKIIINSSK